MAEYVLVEYNEKVVLFAGHGQLLPDSLEGVFLQKSVEGDQEKRSHGWRGMSMASRPTFLEKLYKVFSRIEHVDQL